MSLLSKIIILQLLVLALSSQVALGKEIPVNGPYRPKWRRPVDPKCSPRSKHSFDIKEMSPQTGCTEGPKAPKTLYKKDCMAAFAKFPQFNGVAKVTPVHKEYHACGTCYVSIQSSLPLKYMLSTCTLLSSFYSALDKARNDRSAYPHAFFATKGLNWPWNDIDYKGNTIDVSVKPRTRRHVDECADTYHHK
ncbi:hypothetical protein O181_037137 [Austropuccinia psidii MF-1]|uniref:Uncharacterized protein n=1 Tax=Austropuccinia psidii MF-1 TaxID=1389203 RepID=A0A9Q3D8E8_9BASI|nr:hypothetical protein [Austropuccinia psidii MF-1]